MRPSQWLALFALVVACRETTTSSPAAPRRHASAPGAPSQSASVAVGAPAPSASAPTTAPAPRRDAPSCAIPVVEPAPPGLDRGAGWAPEVTIDKEGAAPVETLRRWLGRGFEVKADGAHVVVAPTGSRPVARSPDGQIMAVLEPNGRLSVLSPKSGPRWSMRPWLTTWHSNVGDAPGTLWVEFPPVGDAMLVRCEADAGMVGLASERLVDRATGRVRAETPSHLAAEASRGFSPGATKLAVAYRKDLDSPRLELHVFDTRTGARTDSALTGPLSWNEAEELVRSPTPCVESK